MSQGGYAEKESTCAQEHCSVAATGFASLQGLYCPCWCSCCFNILQRMIFLLLSRCPSEKQVIEPSTYKHRSSRVLVNLAATRNLVHCRRWLHVKKHFAGLTHVLFLNVLLNECRLLFRFQTTSPIGFCPWPSLLNKTNENLTFNIISVPLSMCGGHELADFLTTCQHLKQMVDCSILNTQAEAVKNNWTANWKSNHL